MSSTDSVNLASGHIFSNSSFLIICETQADGLHIGGPPIKVIVTKFFHHLCHEVISRSEEGWKN